VQDRVDFGLSHFVPPTNCTFRCQIWKDWKLALLVRFTLDDMAALLTEEEKSRYDRQIRVWGAEAQMRIQNSRILMLGFSGMMPEVGKNLVLAGMNVVVSDTRIVGPDNLMSNFLLRDEDCGSAVDVASLPKLQQLNSFSNIETLRSTTFTAQTLSQYSLVLLDNTYVKQLGYSVTFTELTILAELNDACRAAKVPFFYCSTVGDVGLFVGDLGEKYTYIATDGNGNKNEFQCAPYTRIPDVFEKKLSDVHNKRFPVSRALFLCRLFADTMHCPNHTFDEIECIFLKENELPTTFLTTHWNEENSNDRVFLKSTVEYNKANGLTISNTNVMTCSVLGSFLAQEVIKIIGNDAKPLYNVAVTNGIGEGVMVYPVHNLENPSGLVEPDSTALTFNGAQSNTTEVLSL
jgi:ubiquitin-like 1-activating enzyme E1 A